MLEMKYKNSGHKYKVEFSIVALHVLQLLGDFPIKEEGFTLSREGKEDNWDYSGYTTVYREVEGGVQFSDDGSVALVQSVPTVTFLTGAGGSLNGDADQNVNNYNELVIPTPVPDENYAFSGWVPEIPAEGAVEENAWFQAAFSYVPTLEEVKEGKRKEISNACEQIIFAGIDVEFLNGVEHFSLTEKDQINLFGKQAQLAAGLEQLEYHQDGHPCRYYTAEEMQQIIAAAMFHVSYHTTYCNGLNMWIAGAETKDEVNAIFYGADIPEAYQSEVLKDYLIKIAAQEA